MSSACLRGGIGIGLFAFVVLSSLGQVFFTALSDGDRRGTQVGAFQMFGTLATIMGPAAGGLLLAMRGPHVTFAVAFFIALVGILPLLRISEPPLARKPRRAPMPRREPASHCSSPTAGCR